MRKWEGTERLKRSCIAPGIERRKRGDKNKAVKKGQQSEKSSVTASSFQHPGVRKPRISTERYLLKI